MFLGTNVPSGYRKKHATIVVSLFQNLDLHLTVLVKLSSHKQIHLLWYAFCQVQLSNRIDYVMFQADNSHRFLFSRVENYVPPKRHLKIADI